MGKGGGLTSLSVAGVGERRGFLIFFSHNRRRAQERRSETLIGPPKEGKERKGLMKFHTREDLAPVQKERGGGTVK